MSNRPLIVICAAAILTCPLAAQDSTLKRRVGVGITVPDVGLFLPINISRRIRLEPFVDFFSNRADYPVTSDTALDCYHPNWDGCVRYVRVSRATHGVLWPARRLVAWIDESKRRCW